MYTECCDPLYLALAHFCSGLLFLRCNEADRNSLRCAVNGSSLEGRLCMHAKVVHVEGSGTGTCAFLPTSRSLAQDHVQEKGGNITHDDVARVEGVLAVTRAFGNNAMKHIVDAEPEVVEHQVNAKDEFIIIASDGVWDLLTNEAAVRAFGRSTCQVTCAPPKPTCLLA